MYSLDSKIFWKIGISKYNMQNDETPGSFLCDLLIDVILITSKTHPRVEKFSLSSLMSFCPKTFSLRMIIAPTSALFTSAKGLNLFG